MKEKKIGVKSNCSFEIPWLSVVVASESCELESFRQLSHWKLTEARGLTEVSIAGQTWNK